MNDAAGSLRVFVHVPKCGGRTVQRHLARHLGPQFWSVDKRFRYLPLELFSRKFDRTAPAPLDAILAVSGHSLGRSIESLFADRTIVRTLILREPESQVLSWYNFRMMRYITAGQSAYSFRLFLRSMPADPVAHFLLERWLELPWLRIARLSLNRKRHLLDAALSEFAIIADIARTDDVIAGHSAALGIPQRADRANDSRELARQTGWRLVGLGDLSLSEREKLAQSLHLDNYLWRKWGLKQDVALEPVVRRSFIRKELSRVAPQVWRRVIRSRALGRILNRDEAMRMAGKPTAAAPAMLLSETDGFDARDAIAVRDGRRLTEAKSGP